MEEASDSIALGTWNPEVGTSSIKDDLEVLWWCADGNGAVVCDRVSQSSCISSMVLTLSIQEVLNRDRMGLLGLQSIATEDIFCCSHVLLATILVLEDSDLVFDRSCFLVLVSLNNVERAIL